MKIVRIFADQLFAFHYENESTNELDRLLDLWNDISYVYQFIKQNKNDIPKNSSIDDLIENIVDNANDIDDKLYEISEDKTRRLEEFFTPLSNQEYRIVELSKQKGRKNYLRLYAIRIDENCFVITGGAIKFHHLMKDRPHTKEELQKINRCRDFLRENNVIDSESFYEFLSE